MAGKEVLGALDYTAIALCILLSVFIGIKCGVSKNVQKTTHEFILAGKDMPLLPVIMSLSVTLVSGVTMIGNPAEIYRYGIQYGIASVGRVIGMFFATLLFIPVYFQCEVSSVYEFLTARYGKTTKYVASGLFLIQSIIYMSVILLAPALALNVVTNISLEMSILLLGISCTIYSSLGGLRGVLWTDVFQAGLIFVYVAAITVQGIVEVGGFGELISRSRSGQRLNFFNFSLDPTARYTVWNVLSRGIIGGLSYYGASQIEIQRMLSMRSSSRAKTALRLSIIPNQFFQFMFSCFGLIMYSVFYTCNPVTNTENTGIFKSDQVVPYFIVSRFISIPGLTGLCIAGIFSGTLSSLSSVLNSLATVTLVDFVQPISGLMKRSLSERASLLTAKCLSILYGVICISLAFTFAKTDSIMAATNTIASILEGPILAVFLVGVLTRKGTEKCVLIGLFCGVALSSWIAFGNLFSGYRSPPLPFNSSGCLTDNNSSVEPMWGNVTMTAQPTVLTPIKDVFVLHKVAFLWIPLIGLCTTLLVIFFLLICFGWRNNVIPEDSKCLAPITRLWIRRGQCSSEMKETVTEEKSTNLDKYVVSSEVVNHSK